MISYFYKTYFSGFPDYYEYKSLAHMEICKTALKYNEDKGSFATLLFYSIKNEIGHYYTMNNYHVRKANNNTMSINTSPTGYDDSLQFEDIIPSNDNVEDYVIEKVYWENEINKQSCKRKKIIQMRYLGYEQKEIGQAVGMTHQGVSDHLTKFKRILGY